MKSFFDARKPAMLGYQGEEVMELPEVEKPNDTAKQQVNQKDDKKADDKAKKPLNTTTEKSAPISGQGP